VEDRPAEVVLPLEDVFHRCGEHPGAAHEELRINGVAAVGRDGPAVALLVEVRALSNRAPGYRFQYQVPPTSEPLS
jgi:hypothetical protein